MKICACENRNCRYIFRYPLVPPTCPDCGKKNVRPANRDEITRYTHEQEILRKEISMGLWSWG